MPRGVCVGASGLGSGLSRLTALDRLRRATRAACPRVAVVPAEALERRVLLSSVTVIPQKPDGTPGAPVTFDNDLTKTGGVVQDFAPLQNSLLRDGFAEPDDDLFLLIDGIAGQSGDAKHKGAIDLSAVSFGADATIPVSTGTGAGGGAGVGKSDFLALHAVADLSQASPLIQKACATGQHIPKAQLIVRKAGGNQVEFLDVTVEDVLVGSYEIENTPDGPLREEFTLDFTRAKITYTPQNSSGMPGTPVSFDSTAFATGRREFSPAQASLLDDYRPSRDGLFLTLDGVTGTVDDKAHAGAIDVTSFSWGVDATAGTGGGGGGGGGGAGKSEFFELHFVTPVSQVSPKLLEAAATGDSIANATFVAAKSGAAQLDYYKVEAEDVQVSSDRVTTAANGALLEEFTLRFARVEVSVVPQGPDGQPLPAVSFSTAAGTFGVREFAPPEPSLLDGDFLTTAHNDIFLKVDGIPGEAQDTEHGGEILARGASWGVDAVGGSGTGTGGGAGRPTFQELHVSMAASVASPRLIEAAATGEHIRSATLTVRKAGAEQFEFLTQHLEDVLVSSYRLTSAAGGTALEEFTFQFVKSTVTYTPQDADGTAGEAVSFTTDRTVTGAAASNYSPPQPSLLQQDGAETTDDVFIKVDGIPGESTDKAHANEIEALAYAWGADQLGGTGAPGSGGGVGKTVFQEFHFLAEPSRASPKLLQAVATGDHVRTVDITVRHGGTNPVEFIKVHFDDVLVSSHQVTSDGRVLEEYTLNFTKAGYTVTPSDGPGKAGTPVAFQTDVLSTDPFVPHQESLLFPPDPVSEPPDDLFLKIDGIAGGATDKAHAGEVELRGFSFGADLQGIMPGGGGGGGTGGGAGRTSFESLHALANVSEASPKLMEAAATGKHIKFVELTVRRRPDDVGAPLEYWKLKLENVVVGSYEVRADPLGAPMEEFTLQYTKATFTYVPQQPDGTGGTPVAFTNDLLKSGGKLEGFAPAQPSLLDTFALADSNDPIFLDIDGIEGGSTSKGHEGAIAAESFSWGVVLPQSTGTGGGGAGVSRPRFMELHVIAPVSSATPKILEGVVSGKHYKSADLAVRRAAGTQPDYYKVHLADVQISSHELTTAPDGRVLEEFTLTFTDKGEESGGGGSGGGGGTGGDVVPPTAEIEPVDPDPRTSPVDAIEIDFSERVDGFDLGDLVLTRDGGGTNLLTAAQTLTSPDGVHWVLNNLTGLTGSHGTYVLTLKADGTGITDLAGNPLTGGGAIEQWAFSNRPPVAGDDSAMLPEDGTVVIPVLANDTDPDGDALTVTSVGNAAHGTVVQNADGSLTYTPAHNYNGPDSFTYAISDGQGGTTTATVAITVVPVNDKPVATPLTISVAEDGSATFQLGGTDVETAPQDLTITIESLPQRGRLRLASSGQPVAVGQRVPGGTALTIAGRSRCDGPGADGFRFTVTDTGDPAGTSGNVLTSDPAMVSLNFVPAVQSGQIVRGPDGVLRVGGTAGADDISVHGNQLRARFGPGGGATQTVSLAGVKEIRVWGRAGDDRIDLNGADVPVFVSAGAGDDDVKGGSADDVIDGGAGRDDLEGRLGDDLLIGGAGADRLIGAPGNDVLVGGHVDCDVTLGSLRQTLARWADRHQADPTFASKVSDTEEDRLTGAAGGDWFLVSAADKVTGNVKEKHGDLETLIK